VIAAISVDELKQFSVPHQERNPAQFWKGKEVFQKRGIVVEDKDFVIRKRWWELSRYHVGTVQDVDVDHRGGSATVLFRNKPKWMEKPGGPGQASSKEQSITVTRDGYPKHTIAISSRAEGIAVDEKCCGLLIKEEAESCCVEFPWALLALVWPEMNDRVVRGPDWCDGYADGGNTPFGPNTNVDKKCIGVVRSSRDSQGYVEVEWEVTGRITSHRVDVRNFYDVLRVRTE
jgi:hypothetical protein